MAHCHIYLKKLNFLNIFQYNNERTKRTKVFITYAFYDQKYSKYLAKARVNNYEDNVHYRNPFHSEMFIIWSMSNLTSIPQIYCLNLERPHIVLLENSYIQHFDGQFGKPHMCRCQCKLSSGRRIVFHALITFPRSLRSLGGSVIFGRLHCG
jgi:hypothetical protein